MDRLLGTSEILAPSTLVAVPVNRVMGRLMLGVSAGVLCPHPSQPYGLAEKKE